MLFCISGARKVRFSPPVRTVLDFTSVSFTNRFLFLFFVFFFDNAMDSPTIAETEAEHKLFIDRYCKL